MEWVEVRADGEDESPPFYSEAPPTNFPQAKASVYQGRERAGVGETARGRGKNSRLHLGAGAGGRVGKEAKS